MPLPVPTSIFHEWDKQMSRFIWNGKKPRIKYSTLIISKKGAGMSLPNLRDYYQSVQLVWQWIWGKNGRRWREYERVSQYKKWLRITKQAHYNAFGHQEKNTTLKSIFRYLQLHHYFLKETRENEAITEPNGTKKLTAQAYTCGSKSIISI